MTEEEQLEAARKYKETATPEQWDELVRQARARLTGTAKTGTDWAVHYFPDRFNRPFTQYQKDFWDWGETIEKGKHIRPRVECEPRGSGKSSSGEALAIRLLAKKARSFVVMISRTADKAQIHFASMRAMLEDVKLTADYPHLVPHVSELTNRISGWKADRIITADGRTVMALTLKSARGLKSALLNLRPDLIILDDIDLETDSPTVIATNLSHLRNDILPAGDMEGDTVYLMLQNLIHRDSICSQILDQRADILSDRIFCGPYPMLKSGWDCERVDLDDGTGAKQWVITHAEAFDPAIPVEYAERLLNRFGYDAFSREVQQQTDVIGSDKDFREYNEIYHVITWSEFVAGFRAAGATDIQRERIPQRWEVGKGLDVGSTPGHPAVVTYFTIPDQRYPFSDIHFGIGEICMPKFPREQRRKDEQLEVVSPGRIALAMKSFEDGMQIEDSQIRQAKMSHEASQTLNTFIVDLDPSIRPSFQKWKAKRGSGVPQVQNLMEIDKTKPHGFRFYPEGHKSAGEPIMGRTRWIFVVADGQGELYTDGEGRLRVRGPSDALGFSRSRFEIPLYSYRNAGQKKIDDDACFVAGTLISTEHGERPIEEIKVGDLVYTREGLRPVTEARPTGEREIVAAVFKDLPVSDREVILMGTPNHPVYTLEKGFVPMVELCRDGSWTCNAIIRSSDSASSIPIEYVSAVYDGPYRKIQPVYNLKVDEVPEFFANGILVHNCDSFLGLHSTFGLKSADLTSAEKLEKSIPAGFRAEDVYRMVPGTPYGPTAGQEMSYLWQRSEARKRQKPTVGRFDPLQHYK